MDTPPVISAIIVSYNTCALTRRSIEALYADLGDLPAEIFVVDNHSADHSAAEIQRLYPRVRFIQNSENLGFGAANNSAMQQARGDFFLLVNSDAFLHRGAIGTLLRLARQDPRVAVVGPRIVLPDGTLQVSCFRFTTPGQAWRENLWISKAFQNHPVLGDYRHWAHDRIRMVDFVIGACMLVRAEAYRQVGGFDERFFLYAEEADWQWRMHRAGWKVCFTPDAAATHVGGASGIGERARVNHHFFDSLDLYMRKNHGLLGLLSLRLAMIIGCGIRMILWALLYICQPRRRPLAGAKTRLLSWLFVRQATSWSALPRTR